MIHSTRKLPTTLSIIISTKRLPNVSGNPNEPTVAEVEAAKSTAVEKRRAQTIERARETTIKGNVAVQKGVRGYVNDYEKSEAEVMSAPTSAPVSKDYFTPEYQAPPFTLTTMYCYVLFFDSIF